MVCYNTMVLYLNVVMFFESIIIKLLYLLLLVSIQFLLFLLVVAYLYEHCYIYVALYDECWKNNFVCQI